MKKTQDTLHNSDSQFIIVPVVELTFDYIKRDRQKRRYFMENEESCQVSGTLPDENPAGQG